MPRLAANVSTLFTELNFLERFAAAAEAGFKAVEIQFPYAVAADEVAAAAREARVEVVLINLPAGDWGAGERGLAALPGREAEFRDGIETCRAYAQALGCPRVNALAGVPKGADPAAADATLAGNLAAAAEALAVDGILVMTEAANSHDIPGFHLDTTAKALAALDRAGHANLAIQYDVYHMVRMGLDAGAEIESHLDRIGHIQFADVPGRHEPGSGTIDFKALFARIDKAGYAGWCGAEYFPAGATREGLAWFRPYRK